MAYTWKENLVSSSKYSIKCPYLMTPKYVVVHNTANSAPAKNEINYMISNSNQVSFHIAVDDKEAIQGIPFNRNAFHAGDGANGKGNRYGIAVEICYSTKKDGNEYALAEENAVYVCARLLYKYGLVINELKRHKDFANKNCPHRINDENRWDGFKGRVEWVLNEIKAGRCESGLNSGTTTTKEVVQNTPQTTTTYKVGSYEANVKVTDDLNIRSQRHYNSALKGTIPKGTVVKVEYILYQDNSTSPKGSLWGSVYTPYGDGFINMDYTEPTSSVVSNTFQVKVVNCDYLNARKTPEIVDGNIAETVKAGTILTIVGESGNFYKTKSGLYISKKYCNII